MWVGWGAQSELTFNIEIFDNFVTFPRLSIPKAGIMVITVEGLNVCLPCYEISDGNLLWLDLFCYLCVSSLLCTFKSIGMVSSGFGQMKNEYKMPLCTAKYIFQA